jgi:hypothetical protein
MSAIAINSITGLRGHVMPAQRLVQRAIIPNLVTVSAVPRDPFWISPHAFPNVQKVSTKINVLQIN